MNNEGTATAHLACVGKESWELQIRSSRGRHGDSNHARRAGRQEGRLLPISVGRKDACPMTDFRSPGLATGRQPIGEADKPCIRMSRKQICIPHGCEPNIAAAPNREHRPLPRSRGPKAR